MGTANTIQMYSIIYIIFVFAKSYYLLCAVDSNNKPNG